MADVSPWRAALREASFRGIPFEVKDSSQNLGRKVAVHEFALRDESIGEDMGLKTASFRVEGYIIGPDYMTSRDAFEAALKTPGIGILIHPWRGRKSVRLLDASAQESTAEGGMVRYSLEFMEEQAAPSLKQTVDTSAAVTAQAETLQGTADTTLAETFTVANQPNFVLDSAANLVTDLSDQFDALTAPLQAGGEVLSSYVAQALALRTEVFTLVTKPLLLAGQVSAMVQAIRTVAATPADALGVLKTLLGFGGSYSPVTGTTPARLVQANNQTSFVAHVRQSAIVEAVQAVTEMEFAAYQDAVTVRDDICERVDALASVAGDAGDDTTWRALNDVRLAVYADVTARGGSLARLYSFTPPVTVPALVLAHRLYDDISRIEERADEITARNKIVHPGFVRGGVQLEVLSDV